MTEPNDVAWRLLNDQFGNHFHESAMIHKISNRGYRPVVTSDGVLAKKATTYAHLFLVVEC